MYLKQVLFAKFDDDSFTVYKYKHNYLIRKLRNKEYFWSEYDSFALVLSALKAFEYTCNAVDDDDDEDIPMPF